MSGEDARQPAAGGLDLRVLARQAVHVRRRSAEIGNDARKTRRLVADFLDLVQDRLLGAALDDSPFVLGDRAESAAAEAATHDVDREADHLEGRNPGLAIRRMRPALERRGEDAIHLRRRQRDRRRVEPDVALAVRLDQRAGIARVRFEMEDARSVGVKHRVGGDLLVRRQADRGPRPIKLRHALVRLPMHPDHLPTGLSFAAGRRCGLCRTGRFLAAYPGRLPASSRRGRRGESADPAYRPRSNRFPPNPRPAASRAAP